MQPLNFAVACFFATLLVNLLWEPISNLGKTDGDKYYDSLRREQLKKENRNGR